MNVSGFDLVVLAAYFAAVVTLGAWVGRGQRSAADFMLAGRNLPWWLILASIVATETSTVTFLSIPGFAYERDLTWLQLPLGFLLGRIVVAALFLPQYFRGEIFTAYEVLHQRFGVVTRRLAALLFVVTRSLADGLRLFLTAIVLQEMTGLPLTAAVVLTGLATISYTFIGGMRAVLWTDFLQLIVYLIGAGAALWLLLERLPGGAAGLWAMAGEAGKLTVFDLRFDWSDPYVLWAGVLGGLFLTLGSHGADQMMVQRYLCASRERDAAKALVASGFVVLAQFALFLVVGLALWAFYSANPPAQAFDRSDRVFARFIVEQLPPGLLGLVLGAVFAAAMSTLSSSLNSSATAAWNDLLRPLWRRPLPPRAELGVTRALTALFGLVQIGVGVAGQSLDATVVAAVLAIAGFTTGIVLGVFFLALFVPRASERAAVVALATGLAGMTWVQFATPLAWPWFALVGSLGTLTLGWLASHVWPAETRPDASAPPAV